MSEVVVSAVIPAKEGQLDALVEAFAAHTAAVHGEAGCLLYAAHRSDDAVLVIEKWASPEALEAHGKGAAMRSLGEAIGAYVGGRPTIVRATAVPSGDQAKGAVTPWTAA